MTLTLQRAVRSSIPVFKPMKTLVIRWPANRHGEGRSGADHVWGRFWCSIPILLSTLVALSGCASSKNSVQPTHSTRQPNLPSSWSRLRFSPDGTRLAGLRDGEALREFALPHDLTGRDVPLPFGRPGGRLLDLNYDANGDLLVLCHVTNSLMVWNTRKGGPVVQQSLHASPLSGLLSRDGPRVVVLFEGTLVRTNITLALVSRKGGGDMLRLPEHHGLFSLALSGDGERLATVDGNQVGRVWKTETGELLLTLPDKGVGVAVDLQGNTVALVGAETHVQRVEQPGSQPATSVPNAKPKGTTVAAGVGLAIVGLAFNTPPPAEWFTAACVLGACMSDDGKRLAVVNIAPNLKGGYQVRLADAHTGRAEVVRSLPGNFVPSGQPMFSPDGLQVAVPGNGVRVMDVRLGVAKPNDLWLAPSKPPPPCIVAAQYTFQTEPVRATNSVSALARAAHRRVCFEATEDLSGNDRWTIPLPLGTRKVFVPNKEVSLVVNEALKNVWLDCGHELVFWGQEMSLSSRVTKWQLDSSRSFSKGWDLAAAIEVELTLTGPNGAVLHTARYLGRDHQTRLWEPTVSFISQMHARALNACMAEMKNDPKWEQALAASGPAAR